MVAPWYQQISNTMILKERLEDCVALYLHCIRIHCDKNTSSNRIINTGHSVDIQLFLIHYY